uniref:Uncharacterized protein n=1 Tax=Arion vulgaris TaxID=1028688 RepID=A0A0B6Z013_9EUPU
MSYFVGVVLLGYLTWYRRARIKKKKEEAEKLKEEENETEKQDDYRQFLQAAGTGGFSNYATNEYDRQMESNGGAVHKANSFRDCSGACVPFNVKEEEELVEYNASKREISF